jgi:hypothetical protein
VSGNPAIEQLRRLCRFGFTGQRLFNHDGGLDLVQYTREFQGLREVVLVYREGEALAYRTRDLLDPERPWHSTENAMEWRLYSDIVTVVNALLSLPTPRACREPSPGLSRGHPPWLSPEQFPHKPGWPLVEPTCASFCSWRPAGSIPPQCPIPTCGAAYRDPGWPPSERAAPRAQLPAASRSPPTTMRYTMSASPARGGSPRWHDVDGTHIPLLCRIEQVRVRRRHGALPSRLHQQGQVIGRCTRWLFVRFEADNQLILIRPYLVRVIPTPTSAEVAPRSVAIRTDLTLESRGLWARQRHGSDTGARPALLW